MVAVSSNEDSTLWDTYLAKAEHPIDRLFGGESISTEAFIAYSTLRIKATTMLVRDTRCRAVFKVRAYADSDPTYKRCRNTAYLDAFVDPDELLGSDSRVALCWTHARICLQGKLRIAR